MSPEIIDLVPEYIANRVHDLIVIKELAELNQFENIHRIAHKIRGSAGSYGFQDLTVLAEKLEMSAKKSDHEEVFSSIKDADLP